MAERRPQVFAYDDDYSFGILQSGIHWQWFVSRCSTLKSDFRYTSNTVGQLPLAADAFEAAAKTVAAAAVELRTRRTDLMKTQPFARELYRSTELPGANPLKTAQAKLDGAVRALRTAWAPRMTCRSSS